MQEEAANIARQTQLEMQLAGKSEVEIANDSDLQRMQMEADGLAATNNESKVADELTDADIMAMIEAQDAAALAVLAISSNKGVSTEDLSKLDATTQNMINELSKFNSKLNPEAVNKTYEEVKAEVFGTVTLGGKRGLGDHLKAIAASAASGNKQVAHQAVQRLQAFKQGMVTKSQAITDAIATGKSEVKLDNGFTFAIRSKGQAKGFVNNLNKEIATLNKGLRLGAEIYNTTFHKKDASDVVNVVQETTTEPVKETKESISKVTKDDVKAIVKDVAELGSINTSGVALEPREETTDNEVSLAAIKSGSLNTIMNNMKTSSNPMRNTIQDLVKKLSSKNDVRVITSIDGKEIINQFMHYGSNVIGLVMPNKGGIREKGTSNTTVLHEALHAYLNDYLTTTDKSATSTRTILQMEYMRVFDAYNTALKNAENPSNKGALDYASQPSELYAMFMNNRTVSLFLDSVTDTGSIAKGYTLLDSFLDVVSKILAKVFKKSMSKEVKLSDSLQAVIVNALKDIAGELQAENSPYITALANEGKVVPDNVYRLLLENESNLTKDGKVKANILHELGMDAKLRDELHNRVVPPPVGTKRVRKAKSPKPKKVKEVVKVEPVKEQLELFEDNEINDTEYTETQEVRTEVVDTPETLVEVTNEVTTPDAEKELDLGSLDPLFTKANELLRGLITSKGKVSTETYDKLTALLQKQMNVTYNKAVALLDAVILSVKGKLKDLDLTLEVKEQNVIPLYENEVVANIFNYQKGVELITRKDGTTEIPLAMTIKNMDESMVLRSETPTSIYSRIDAIGSNEGIEAVEAELTEAEQEAYLNVLRFNSMFSRTLNKVIPSFLLGKDKITLLRDKAVEQPLSMLVGAHNSFHYKGSKDKGMLHQNLVNAMGTATMKWFADNGAKTSYNNDSTIARIKGYSDDSQVTPHDRAVFANAGIPAATVALSIGKEVLRMLNVKQNPNASSGVDAFYDERLAQQIGDFALLSLHNMHDSNGNMQNLVEYTHVPIQEFFKEGVTEIKNAEATVAMIRMPVPLNEYGSPIYIDGKTKLFPTADEVINPTKEKAFKTMYKKIVSPSGENVNTSLEPITLVPTTYKNSYSAVPDILKDAVASFQRNKVMPNANYNLKKLLSKETWLKMHGWVTPEFIEEQHLGLQAKYKGKNQTLEQEYDKMTEHDMNMEIELGSIDSKYSINDNKAKGFYIPYTVMITGRIMDTSKTITLQRSKMHRNAFTLASQFKTIETHNAEHKMLVIKSMIEPFGLKEFETMKPENMVDAFHETVMKEDGTIINEVLAAGVKAILDSRNNIDFDEDAILHAVEQLGEHGHSLLALQGLATWSDAIVNGKPTWVTDMYTEVDGKTNGVIALARQIGIEFADDEDGTKLMKVLNAGGMFFEGQENFESLNDYMRAGNLDNYQNVGINAAAEIDKTIAKGRLSEGENKDLIYLYRSLKNVNKGVKRYKEALKSGVLADTGVEIDKVTANTRLKILINEAKQIKDVINEYKARTATQDIKDIMPNFIKENPDTKEKTLSSEGRNAAKPYVMTGAYQAGEYGQTVGGFYESVLPSIYKDMMEAHAKGDMEYFVKLNNSINNSLKSNYGESNSAYYDLKDIDGTKLAEVKAEFPREVEESLLRSYQASYGKAMVQGYKQALGSVVTSGEMMVQAMSVVSSINAHVMNAAVRQASEGRTTPLNKQEKEALYKKLLSQGVYVGVQAAASTGWRDSIITMEETKEYMDKKDGGKTETRLNDTLEVDGKNIKIIRSKLNGKPVEYKSINSTLKSRSIAKFAGVSPIVMANIGVDALTQALVSKTQYDSEFVNVYDAQIWDVLNATKNTVNTNEQWNEVHRNWSMVDAIQDRLNYSLELFKTLSPEVQTEIEESVLYDERFPLDAESFNDFKVKFDKLAAKIRESKNNIDTSLIKLEQYSTEGGAKSIDEKATLAKVMVSFNFNDVEEAFNVEENVTAPTTASVMKLFMELGSVDANHSPRLEDILIKNVLPLIVNSGKYVFNFSENQDKQVLRDKLEIHVPNVTANTLFGETMSAQELMVNEALYPVWKTAISTSTNTLSALVALHAKARSVLTANDIGSELHKQLFETKEGILDFAVMGMTNEKFITAMNDKMGTVRVDTSVTNKLQDLFNKVARFFNSKFELGTAKPSSILNGLALDLYAAKNSAATSLWNKVTENRVIKAMDNVKTMDKLVDVVLKAGEAKKPLGALAYPLGLVDEKLGRSVVEVVDAVEDAVKGNALTAEIGKLYNESKGGTGIKRNFHKLLTKANEHVDSAAMKINTSITNLLNIEFGKLTPKEWKALTNTVLRTEFTAIGSLAEVRELMSSDAQLDAEIIATAKLLKSSDRAWVMNQVKSLGHFMATNKVLMKDTLLNASNISKGVGRTSVVGVTEADLKVIDKLKSLYAIKFTSRTDKEMFMNLSNNTKGIELLITLKNEADKQTLSTVYNNDVSQVQAGKIVDIGSDYIDYSIRPTTGNNNGYTLVHNLNSDYAVYTRKSGSKAAYNRGIVSIAGDTTEGKFVKLTAADSKEGYVPVVKDGMIVGYKLVIPNEVKAKLGISDKAHQVVATMTATRTRLDAGRSYNKELIDLAADDFKKNFLLDNRKFIAITKDSLNPQVAEFARLMPKEFMNDLKARFPNGKMYLRKDMLDLVIGYRKFSAVNYVGERYNVNPMVLDIMKRAEDVYQVAVGEVKRRVVILTPAVVAANFISNLVVSVLFGMNPMTVLKDQTEGLAAIRAYTAWDSELSALKVEMVADKAMVPAKARRIKELQFLMEQSGVHRLVQEGMFSTIVEDVDPSSEDAFTSKLATAARLNSNKDNEGIVSDRIPEKVKHAMAIAALSPTTTLGNEIRLATAYSDFIARYAMYKHLIAKGMNHEDASSEVMDIYVDYAPNTSKSLQYINDMGIFMYTKFLVRIQKVIIKLMQTNKKGIAALIMAEQMMGNVPDITDASVLYGIGLGRMNSPSDVFDTVADIPLLHFLKGFM